MELTEVLFAEMLVTANLGLVFLVIHLQMGKLDTLLLMGNVVN